MKAVLKVVTVIIVCTGFSFSAHAQNKKKQVAPKKVDVENLEKRYWAPKDKKFKVVQNRSYTKTNKFFLSVMPGLMLNEEYSDGFATDLALGYFFNDRWGLELEYQTIDLDDNDLQSEVIGLGGFANHGKTTDYIGVTAKWMPFYAKMSFLGNRIVYFDLSLGLSLGTLSYEQQTENNLNENSESAIAYGLELSQSFYLSRKLLLRVDYKHRFYSQKIIEGSTLNGRGDSRGDRSEDSLSLNAGLTYIF